MSHSLSEVMEGLKEVQECFDMDDRLFEANEAAMTMLIEQDQLLRDMLAAQMVEPYRGWNITTLNKVADRARAYVGLPSVLDVNPDIKKMVDAVAAIGSDAVRDIASKCLIGGASSRFRFKARQQGLGFEDLEAARSLIAGRKTGQRRPPSARGLAPLYRPGFLLIRLYRAVSPAPLLVGAATHIEGWIEQYLAAHPSSVLQGVLSWLIKQPGRGDA